MIHHCDVGCIFTSAPHKAAPFLCNINLQALQKSSLFSRFQFQRSQISDGIQIKRPRLCLRGGPGRTSDPRLTDGQRRRQEIDKLSFCLKCDELHCSRSVTPLRWDQTRVTDVMDEKHQRRRSSVESERESLQLQPGAKTNFFFSSNICTETEQNAGFKHRNENNLKASGLA